MTFCCVESKSATEDSATVSTLLRDRLTVAVRHSDLQPNVVITAHPAALIGGGPGEEETKGRVVKDVTNKVRRNQFRTNVRLSYDHTI